MILLDSDICTAAIRGDKRVTSRLLQYGGRVKLPFVVIAELRFGVERLVLQGLDPSSLKARINRFLTTMDGVVTITDEAIATYAQVRAQLERGGTPIGPNDLWIAALALAEDALLVTGNTREFRRVPGLRVENWLGR